MHWGRKHRHQSFLKKGGGITLVLGAAFAALESDGSVDGSDETDGELDGEPLMQLCTPVLQSRSK